MNRQIKFRAWHIEAKTMWQFELLDGNHGHGNGYIGMWPVGENKDTPSRYRGNMSLIDPMECEIMQFTGLTDKNGKEIYEGDIMDYGGGRVVIVEFEEGCFGLRMPLGNFEKCWLSPKHFAIIGNKFQNPELLDKATVTNH